MWAPAAPGRRTLFLTKEPVQPPQAFFNSFNRSRVREPEKTRRAKWFARNHGHMFLVQKLFCHRDVVRHRCIKMRGDIWKHVKGALRCVARDPRNCEKPREYSLAPPPILSKHRSNRIHC